MAHELAGRAALDCVAQECGHAAFRFLAFGFFASAVFNISDVASGVSFTNSSTSRPSFLTISMASPFDGIGLPALRPCVLTRRCRMQIDLKAPRWMRRQAFEHGELLRRMARHHVPSHRIGKTPRWRALAICRLEAVAQLRNEETPRRPRADANHGW